MGTKMPERRELTKKELSYYASLKEKRYRRKYKKFILEGVRFVRDALLYSDNSPYRLDEIFVDFVLAEKKGFDEIVRLAKEKSVPVSLISRWQMEKISAQDTPQGVFAVLSMPERTDDARWGEVLTKKGTVLFLDGVQDPGNCGTLIRSAAAFGALAVIIGQDTAKLYNPKVIQATAGAFFHIPVLDLGHRPGREIVGKFVEMGFELLITGAGGKPIYEITPSEKMVLVVGNEGSGVRDEIFTLPHTLVTVPITRIDSLNAAVAGSVALYEISKKLYAS